MRIIGGSARGRRLKAPKGRALRPTAARVKEALFNILPHDLSGAKVWVAPVNRALRLLGGRRETFDIIFLDPPYDQRLVETTLRTVARGGLLRQTGTLIAEHSIREEIAPRYDPSTRPPAIAGGHSLGVPPGNRGVESGVPGLPRRLLALELSDQRRYGDTLLSFFKLNA